MRTARGRGATSRIAVCCREVVVASELRERGVLPGPLVEQSDLIRVVLVGHHFSQRRRAVVLNRWPFEAAIHVDVLAWGAHLVEWRATEADPLTGLHVRYHSAAGSRAVLDTVAQNGGLLSWIVSSDDA